MRERTAKRFAWGSWIVATSLAALALLFLILGRSTPSPPGAFGFRGFSAIFAVAFGTVGALIASRHPRNPIGWIFCGMAVASGFQELCQQYAIYAALQRHGELPLGQLAAWIPSWIWIPITSGAAYLLLLFPDGHMPSSRWRPLIWVEITGTVLGVLGLAFAPGPLENFHPVTNPLGIGTQQGLLTLAAGGELLYGLGIIAAAIALVMRFRRSRGEERQQLKWLAFAGLFMAFALSFSFVSQILNAGRQGQVAFAVSLLVIAGFVSVPTATGIGIMKYRLYDIDVVINKTVVYGGLAAFISLIYVLIVAGIGAAFRVSGKPSVALSIAATAVVAVAFQPVRARMQRFANRLVYGERATPYEVLSGFSQRAAGTYSTEDVLPRTARVLAEGTGAARAEVWLRTGRTLRPAAGWPAADGSSDRADTPRDPVALSDGELPDLGGDRSIPVRYQGELLGAVTVTKPVGEPLTPAEERLLTDLASQAGLVLRNVSLTRDLEAKLDEISRQASELRASRQRIVAAQDAERKRLERNIHDGAQQHLVALAVKLRLARSLVARDAEKAKTMLAELREEVGDALDTLRDLARGIYPPVLEEHGIATALAAQTARSDLPVRFEARGIGRRPIEAEAAVYFCCLEALQNAAKYASASEIVVRIEEDGDDLLFAITDDGAGFDPAEVTEGSGLQNMRDRVAALGGRVEVESMRDQGTRVTGRVPAPVEVAR